MSKIVVSLYGGAGNQLFQYAAGRALAIRCHASLVLDLGWFEAVKESAETTPRHYALAPFGLQVDYLSKPQPLIADGFIARVRRKMSQWIPCEEKDITFSEQGFMYDPRFETLSAPVWLKGYWQSQQYFKPCEDIIRFEIGTPNMLNPESQSFLEHIQATDSICVHVRRGDYVTNPSAAATHGLCSLDYYCRGIEIAKVGLKNPVCFLFSDDPDWVRTNINIDLPIVIVDANGPNDAHQDLWLMSACKRFVIANSSLSWWGAWLGTDKGKQVVAPKQWFASGAHDTRDLIPEEWVRI